MMEEASTQTKGDVETYVTEYGMQNPEILQLMLASAAQKKLELQQEKPSDHLQAGEPCNFR